MRELLTCILFPFLLGTAPISGQGASLEISESRSGFYHHFGAYVDTELSAGLQMGLNYSGLIAGDWFSCLAGVTFQWETGSDYSLNHFDLGLAAALKFKIFTFMQLLTGLEIRYDVLAQAGPMLYIKPGLSFDFNDQTGLLFYSYIPLLNVSQEGSPYPYGFYVAFVNHGFRRNQKDQ